MLMNFQSATGTGYTSPRHRAQWAIAILGLVIVVTILAVLTEYSRRDLMHRIRDREDVTVQEAQKSDDRASLMAMIQAGALLLSAVTFLAWLYLAYRNLYAFGAEGLEYSPRWTWLGFVIPIMCLFRPYQVAAEIWKASGPKRGLSSKYVWVEDDIGDIVRWWWGSWLVMNILGRLPATSTDQTIEGMLRVNAVTISAHVVTVLAAGIAMLFVWSLTVRQENRAAPDAVSVSRIMSGVTGV
jgi:hypothetical protein